jgi:multiple sugar transport system permease protein
MKHFIPEPRTLEELKKLYRTLTKIHHPDCGGTNDDMKVVNAEYKTLFEKYPMGTWYVNTIIVAVFTLIGNLTTSLLAGYALAKFKFRGQKIIFSCILALLMIPFQILLTPLYIMVAKLGWHNTNIGLIVPFLVNCLSIFMARQFYMSFPDELIEAARIDGVGYIRSYFKIALPLSGPLVITLAILDFTSCWNAYLVPATFLARSSAYTLPVGLTTVKAANFIRPNETMAGVILLSLPIIMLFLILQKWSVRGIATTGIKE